MNAYVELNRIQAATKNWRDRNFPGWTGKDQLIGVIEETGELAHSYLKAKQGIRGTLEEHLANERDAIGDIMIYLMGYASANEIIMATATGRANAPTLKGAETTDKDERMLCYFTNRVGRLAHWEACSYKPGQFEGIKRRVVGEIVMALWEYSRFRGYDFMECVDQTWTQVSQRDWVSNPQDGSVPA